jgi:hypothetical protein
MRRHKLERAIRTMLRLESKSVLDILDERDAGEIDTATMMKRLRAIDYTDGYVPYVNGILTDAYVRGSWDDVKFAYYQDKLTFDEYSELARIRRARNSPTDGGAQSAW